MKLRIISTALCLAGFIWAGNAAAYVVGGPQQVYHTLSGSWNWENGPTTALLRDALENPNFFGPGGVVNETCGEEGFLS